MSSILTNTGAMVALQTLRKINAGLAETQNQVSTGMKVSSAKENAAVFAISKVMEADVTGFKALSDSLRLGESTVAVAANGAKQVSELLNEIKGKIVAANQDNIDRVALNDELQSLVGQIDSIVSAAQFNGLNLLDGTQDGAGGFSVLSSLNRDSAGNVSTGQISFDPTSTNLSTTSGTVLATAAAADNSVAAASVFTATNQAAGGAIGAVTAGVYSVTLTAVDGATDTDGVIIGGFDFQTNAAVTAGTNALTSDFAFDDTDTTGLIAGDNFEVTVGTVVARYTVKEGDSQGDIAAGLRDELISGGIDTDAINVSVGSNANGVYLAIDNLTNRTDIEITAQSRRASGGLAGLDALDISTEAGATAAVAEIETYIQAAVDAQAVLGTTAKRLEIQVEFMSSQIDSFKAGIGALVDADMEEVSARLQALQVQQQLGVQSLSIANQAPQTILSLFGG